MSFWSLKKNKLHTNPLTPTHTHTTTAAICPHTNANSTAAFIRRSSNLRSETTRSIKLTLPVYLYTSTSGHRKKWKYWRPHRQTVRGTGELAARVTAPEDVWMSSGWHPLLLASPEATLKSGLDLISVTFNNGHEDVKNERNLSNECINSQSQPTWDFMVSNPQPPGGQVRTNAALLQSCILQPKEHRSPRSWCNVSNKPQGIMGNSLSLLQHATMFISKVILKNIPDFIFYFFGLKWQSTPTCQHSH